MAVAAWFLITVLNSGQPGDAKGFPTKHLCEEARSVVMWGRGIKEHHQDSVEWRKKFPKGEIKGRFRSVPCTDDAASCYAIDWDTTFFPTPPLVKYVRCLRGDE